MLGKPSGFLMLGCRLFFFLRVFWCFYFKSQPTFPPQRPKMAPHLRAQHYGGSTFSVRGLPESSAAAFQVLSAAGGGHKQRPTHTHTQPPQAAGRWGRWLGRLAARGQLEVVARRLASALPRRPPRRRQPGRSASG